MTALGRPAAAGGLGDDRADHHQLRAEAQALAHRDLDRTRPAARGSCPGW